MEDRDLIKYITPYKYGYTLNKREVERTENGNFVIYQYGKQQEVGNLTIEFGIPGERDMLTKEQFYKIIEGTKGIESIYGEFKKEPESFDETIKPVMKWLAENQHPHTKIILDSTNAELVEGIKSVVTNEYIVD